MRLHQNSKCSLSGNSDKNENINCCSVCDEVYTHIFVIRKQAYYII